MGAPGRIERRAIIVVTGIQAVGKSTVARLLAGRFARGAHVEADALQRMIVSGGLWPEEPGEPGPEAARQLRLRLMHMCALGISFYQAGFAAVLDDIILGDRWAELREDLRGYPFALVVLAPRREVVIQQRDVNRGIPPIGADWAAYLDDILRATMTGKGLWVDSSAQTPDETVDEIVRGLGLGGEQLAMT